MEPISAVASIIGLLGAAAKISEYLFKFIKSVKDAPKLASSVLQEVSDTSACLNQLQNYLMGTRTTSRPQGNLLMVEQIVVALSNCVLVFSELEEIVESLKPSNRTQSGRLAQWILKEQTITSLLTRLHISKLSINLMMTTLTCTSIGEVQESVTELAAIITNVLESNQEISRRMARFEQQSFRTSPSTIRTTTGKGALSSPSVAETNTVEDTESIVTIRGPGSDSQKTRNSESRPPFGFSFDQDLNTSRPYTRAMKRDQTWSITSSEIHTLGWSYLSGISLAEVSHVSVINLPFSPQDLWNGQRYLASKIDRIGFFLSKPQSNSSSSITTQSAPTPKSGLETKIPVSAGRSSGSLSMIREGTGLPVAARNIATLGIFSSLVFALK